MEMWEVWSTPSLPLLLVSLLVGIVDCFDFFLWHINLYAMLNPKTIILNSSGKIWWSGERFHTFPKKVNVIVWSGFALTTLLQSSTLATAP